MAEMMSTPPAVRTTYVDDTTRRPPFGAWLVQQDKRDGWIRDFALTAKADRSFPRNGDPEAVRKWLSGKLASGDDWEALEDAENDWLCL